MENYKTTKTIRFKLNVEKAEKLQNEIDNKTNDFNLVNFASDLNNFIEGLNDYLFYCKNKEAEIFAIKDKMFIKKEWLRTYAKQELANFNARNANNRQNNNSRIRNTIGDFSGLSNRIEQRFDEVDEIYIEIAKDTSAKLNERAKRTRTGLLLQQLKTKLPFLLSLIENTTDKNEINDLSIRLKRQAGSLEEKLLAGIEEYLSEQSSGLPVAKASFNFYTLNKNPIDFKRQIEKLNNELKVDWDKVNKYYDKRRKNRQYLDNKTFEKIKSDEVTDYEQLRQLLKNIKANQKSKFNELITDPNFTYQKLKGNEKLYLFNNITEQQFNEYKQKTEELTDIATKLSNQTERYSEVQKKNLRAEKQEIAKERGDLLKDEFIAWKSFANFYRIISQKHGKILTQLKGIKKEQIESQLLKYWSFIWEQNKQYKLVLIPKEKAAECKRKLESSNSQPGISTDSKMFWFESFTYRSLRKLCFGNLESQTNSFYPELAKELINKYYETNKLGEKKFISGEFLFEGDEQKKIEFYKDVLNSEYVKQVLKLPLQQIKAEIIDKTFENLDEFQIALEKICYRRFVKCDNTIIEQLQQYEAQIFEISSLDLQRSLSEIKTLHKDKHHTKIWKEFWDENNETANFDIRLNPEITITWREAKGNRVAKYGKDSKLHDSNKKNRYLFPQFTLVTTISEHSNTPTKVLSFMSDEEFKDAVDEFNKNFKKENVKFAIGIDNGTSELSTLGIYISDFVKNSNEEIIAAIKDVDKNGFNVLTIKDLSYSEKDINDKSRKIIQNPSYFIDKELYMRTFGKSEEEYEKMFELQFEEKRLLTLDLTTAKVINGYIVTNGDIPTHLNLRIKNAQRLVYEINDHSREETAQKVFIKSNTELTDEEKMKFAESLFTGKHFSDLDETEKKKYVDWLFTIDKLLTIEEENKFKKIRKHQIRVGNFSKDNLFAIAVNDKENQSINDLSDICDVFQLRKDFYAIKSEKDIRAEIELFNKRTISNEELGLKINYLKQSIVGNAIGVIDFLYKYYKKQTNGEGLIVKEGFDTKKVAEDLEKFSGNIYRILERKLYQKFQNYGLVPPIKSLMAIREDGIDDEKTHEILRVGNIGFVSKAKTSQNCPVCGTNFGNHQNNFICSCGFSPDSIMHSNDGIAGYNIAKRGFENFNKQQ
jgi:hypothetical protein